MLPRIQGFEFNELSWLPPWLRQAITRSITFDQWVQGCFRGELPCRFARWLERTGATEVLDIGSGSGGPVQALVRGLRGQGVEPPRFHLSDRYPDAARYVALSSGCPAWSDEESAYVDFVGQPVDALADPLPVSQRHFTLVNVAHHFPPDLLRRILGNLARQGRGIFVIETFYRSLLRFTPLLLASVVPSWVAPLVVKPWRWGHFLLGTVVPLVPLLMMFDGFVTALRSYHPEEWRRMVGSVDADGYAWEIDRLRTGTVYVAGWRQ